MYLLVLCQASRQADRANKNDVDAFRCGENNAPVASERTNADYTCNDLRRIAMSKDSLRTVTCPKWFLPNRTAAHRVLTEQICNRMLTSNVRSRKFPFFTFYAHPCRKPRSFDEKTAFFSYVLFIQNVVHFSFINHVHLRVREQTLRTTKFHSVCSYTYCDYLCLVYQIQIQFL